MAAKHTFHILYDQDRQNIKIRCTEEKAVSLSRILSADTRVIVTAETAGTSVATIPAGATFAETRIAVAKMLDAGEGL